MAATLAELKIYDLKETIDQEDLSVTIKDKAKLSPPSANAVACTILQLHSASDAQAPLRLFVPHRLLLIAPPPQTAQSSSLPDQTTQNYLYSLAKDAEEAAVSQSCSSILAGLGSESDDFGDVAVWLGQGEYGRGHEADALKRLGFEQWATHGQISVLPPSSVLANFKQPTPQLAKLAEDIAWLTDAHFFRLQVPGMSGGVVVFFYLGQLAAHGKPAGWGGLMLLLRCGSDEWSHHGVTTTFRVANLEEPDPNHRVTDGCGFGWRFTYVLTTQNIAPAASNATPDPATQRQLLSIGFDPYLLVRASVGIVDIVARSPQSLMRDASKTLGTLNGNTTTVLDDRGNTFRSETCPVCDFVYRDIRDLKADTITISVSFQSPDIRMPVLPPALPAAAKFTQRIYDTVLTGAEVNDVEFILPSRKSLDRVTAYGAVYGNREVLQGMSSYLDTLLFDDHFAEASPREFGVYKAPSASHVLDYDSDSDLEEEIEDEAKPTTQGKTASPARSTHSEGKAQGNTEKRPSSPNGIVALSDAFRDPQKLNHGDKGERKKGRVVHVDGFAYHTWKSLVFYLYTGKIEFCALKSTNASQTSSQTEISPAACSPKSMYRIAHMLEILELQTLCLRNIEAQLSAENIVQEAFSAFTSWYPDVKEMEILTLKKYYNECAEERKAILGRVVKGELPHCEDIVEAMMNFTK
ncbi:hypothetical protein K523DRAFT_325661 [Schizophyllum commune Tattone D]|nr:hypothetical protein K523DRAFT_325661 [Schizophyllum commune Tattone D]